ncbi:MAG: DUF4129 domain-containing protein [Candidatus Baldrarchaeia archaeon]
MKGLLILTVIGLLIVSSLHFVITAQYPNNLTYIPHEDPNTAQERTDTTGILMLFVNISEFAASENYDDAKTLLAQLNKITVSEDLKYTIWRLTNLSAGLIDILQELKTTLHQAEILLDQMLLNDSIPLIEKAENLTISATILLREIKDAVETLYLRLNLQSAMEIHLKDKLDKLLVKLEDLLNKYKSLLNDLKERVHEINERNLNETILLLYCNTTKAFVGSFVKLYGTLSWSGGALPSRQITILLNEVPLQNVTTDSNGNYEVIVKLPYIYTNSISFRALFVPSDDDKLHFLGSKSPQVAVQLLFFKTFVNVTIMGDAHPGLPINVTGIIRVENQTTPGKKLFQIFIDNKLLVEDLSNPDGTFNVSVTLNPNISVGLHKLTVHVKPNKTHSGASVNITFAVTKLPLHVHLDAPYLVFAPLTMTIKGNISWEQGPFSNATIIIMCEDRIFTTKPDDHGSFKININVEFFPSIIMDEKIEIFIKPVEPWFSEEKITIRIVKINIVNMGLLFMFAATFGFLALPKKRFTIKKPARKEELPVKVEPPHKTIPSEMKIKVLEKNVRMVVKIYEEALKTLLRKLNLRIEPYMTLREILKLVSSDLKETYKPFSKLTFIVEKSIYSMHPPSEKEIEEARHLLEDIKRGTGE